MRIDADRARSLLASHRHGVFGTIHPERGPDLVPVVYAIADDQVGIPVDTIKPKASTRLRREDNLRRDPRASLLIEHWDAADWTRLWWVRATLLHVPDPSAALVETLSERLAGTVSQYANRPFDHLMVARLVQLTGWSAVELPTNR